MPKNDLIANEKRWRRKSLFRKQRPNPVVRLSVTLLVLVTLTLLALWLDIPFVSDYAKELLL